MSLSGDATDEPNETFTATLAYSDQARPELQGGDPTATVTISDSDDPRVSISADSRSVTEGTQSITFTLRRDGLLDASLRVNVRVTETGNMLASSRPSSARFESNSDTASLRVNLTDDAEDEEESEVTVEVLDGTGYLPGSPPSAETAVTDNDHVPVTLSWEELNLIVAEDAGTAILTAVATTDRDKMPESGFTFEVKVDTRDGSAAQPDDYSAPAGTATFGRSDFSRVAVGSQHRYRAARRFFVPIVNDNEDEPDENFTATLAYSDPAPPHLGGGNSRTIVTIADDDHAPVLLSWEQPELAVFEDAGRVALRAVAVTKEDKKPETGFTFDVRVSTTDGSATQPADYIRLSATEIFAWNEFSRTSVDGRWRYRAVKEYHVDVVHDSTAETNESFTVNLAYATPGQSNLLEGDLTAKVSIIEDVTSTVDLQLTGSAVPSRISQGDSLTYRYMVRNDGPALATGVSLVSNLDPNVTFTSTDRPAECNHSGDSAGGTVTCALTDLTSGQTLSISVSTTTNFAPDEGVVTKARISSSTTDRLPGNNASGIHVLSKNSVVSPLIRPPGQVGDFRATAGSSTQINLTWGRPNSNGSSITGYRLERRSVAGSFSGVTPGPTSGDTSYSNAGLFPSSTYTYRLRAVNARGPGPWSTDASATTNAGVRTANPRRGGSGGGGGGGGGGIVPSRPPAFIGGVRTTITVTGIYPAGANVGRPVSAVDATNYGLTYSLGGPDAAFFTINESTGQIRVAAGTTLDYRARKNTYTVDVTARNILGATATTRVTITVTSAVLGRLGSKYDADNNEVIDLEEVLAAIRDYFNERVSLAGVLELVKLYFAS